MEEKIEKVAEVELPNDDNNEGNSTSGSHNKKDVKDNLAKNNQNFMKKK